MTISINWKSQQLKPITEQCKRSTEPRTSHRHSKRTETKTNKNPSKHQIGTTHQQIQQNSKYPFRKMPSLSKKQQQQTQKEKRHRLSGPPSWATASTKRSCRSAVHRSLGLGSAVSTRLGPWISSCVGIEASCRWIKPGNISFWEMRERREAQKVKKEKSSPLACFSSGERWGRGEDRRKGAAFWQFAMIYFVVCSCGNEANWRKLWFFFSRINLGDWDLDEGWWQSGASFVYTLLVDWWCLSE